MYHYAISSLPLMFSLERWWEETVKQEMADFKMEHGEGGGKAGESG